MKGTYSQSSLWDRREFLKGAALSAGAGVAAGCASAFRSGAHIAGPRRVDLQVNGRVGVSFTDRKFITWECMSCVLNNPYMGTSTGGMVYGLDGAVLFRANATAALFDKSGKMVREWTDGDCNAPMPGLNRVMSFGSRDVAHLARFADCIRTRDPRTASTAGDAVKSVSMTHFANIAQLTGETVRTDAVTGALVSASDAARKLWSRDYAPGWEMT